MLERLTIAEFEVRIALVLSKTHLRDQDRDDLKAELLQHLYDHYQELIDGGTTHEQAVKQTIDQFGDTETIRKRISQNYPSTLREFLFRELIIVLILIMSIIIGPIFLLNDYRIASMLGAILIPFLTLLLVVPFKYLVLNRIKTWKVSLLLTIVIYVGLIGSEVFSSGSSLAVIVGQIFSFNIYNYVNGSSGLFTMASIHLFWILILVNQLIVNKSRTTLFQRMISSSFQYWGMLLFGIIVTISLPSNSETQIVFINTLFISTFLEQILSDQIIHLIDKKLCYSLRSNQSS
jgi:hypothetical protein